MEKHFSLQGRTGGTRLTAQGDDALAADVTLIPMQRWSGEEEMSALACMTGTIIPIDGGFQL
ncbi:hypothetical protein [Metapseudomonas otitidis]|uniref:hypothetical protein n=1 Tax=Metapseudomonas otitidis TaxID=319939 RepID=UPI001981C029